MFLTVVIIRNDVSNNNNNNNNSILVVLTLAYIINIRTASSQHTNNVISLLSLWDV